MAPKYPLHLNMGYLSGPEGNAFAIMGRVTAALRRIGVSSEEVSAYLKESTSGDYERLKKVARDWVGAYWEDE
jgi:hypothetical protein